MARMRIRYQRTPVSTEAGIRFTQGGTDPRPQPKEIRILLLRTAYRRLLRVSLQAVRFSTPARYQIRSILRESFRASSFAAFNPRRIDNTVSFLEQAREHNGYEHKILRNLLHVRYWRDNLKKEKTPLVMKQNNEVGLDLRRNLPGHFNATLDMLNESMDLCLRV